MIKKDKKMIKLIFRSILAVNILITSRISKLIFVKCMYLHILDLTLPVNILINLLKI